ncbi:MAG TPA: RsmB/NOP family class I SAM-dependent RNA methyltransferase [Opitutaceae bacterium]|nr:RsmB/NOP family class I SAM-dependent RNA methyltransferase [Opitutaceae bacterium]
MAAPARFHPGQPERLRELLGRLRPHWRRDPGLPARIETLLRQDRRFGSNDRRLYRELIYTALRYLPWIEPLLAQPPGALEKALAWLAAETPATAAFRRELAGDWPPCPPGVEARAAQLGAEPDAVLPSWLRAERPEAFAPAQRDCLLSRAPLWLRLQGGDPAAVLAEFAARGWAWRTSPLLPRALALESEADVTATEAYRLGRLEVQDAGSQLVLEAAGPEPGGRWLDACAGAGGKSLQLADLLGPEGRVDAHDIRPQALAELERRAARAGWAGRIARRPDPGEAYDGVLVDAPCSGSGTWRRSPHLKWTTRPAQLAGWARRQAELLVRFAPRVRPGGRLIYATCSLARTEDEAVAEAFLAGHPEFSPAPWARPLGGEARGPGLLFWPAAHDGDGFFAASFRRG